MAAKAKHLFSTKVELSKSNMFFFQCMRNTAYMHMDMHTQTQWFSCHIEIKATTHKYKQFNTDNLKDCKDNLY